MDKRRRDFLAAAGIAGTTLVIAACGKAGENSANASNNAPETKPLPTRNGVAIGPGQYRKGEGMFTYIALADLDDKDPEPKIIPTKFFGHGISPHPTEPHRALVFEKHGKGCCEVDFKKYSVIRSIPTVDDREFYGHGAWAVDGKSFFAVETLVGDGSYDGVVAIRDDEKAEIQGTFKTHGVAPHDCLLIDDGGTLVFTNGGAPIGSDDAHDRPSVTYVDAKTQKLQERLTFDNLRINAGHIAITSKGDLAVVSAPREGIPKNDKATGAISFYSPGGSMRTPKDPILGKMKLETLSVAIHEPSMIVGCTSPSGNLVTFWEHGTGKLVKTFDGVFAKPRGISVTLNQKYFVLTYHAETRLVLIDAKTLEPVEDSALAQSFMAGSHNITHDI